MTTYTIYAIQHRETGMTYIGSTSNLTARMANHKSHSRTIQNKFYNLIRSNGWGSVDILKLQELVCSDKEYLDAEQYWIDQLTDELKLNTKRAKEDKEITKQKLNKNALEHYHKNKDYILQYKKLYYQNKRKYDYENNYERISKIFRKILI